MAGASQSQVVTNYDYDTLGRLKTAEDDSAYGTNITIDEAGNIESVAVGSTNAPPSAVTDNIFIDGIDNSVTFDLLANDTDPDGPNSELVLDGANLTLALPNADVVMAADQRSIVVTATAEGIHEGSYVVDDAFNGSAAGTFRVEVFQANRAPVAQNDSYSVVDTGQTLVLDLLANDTDADIGDNLRISWIEPPTNGTLIPETPGPNQTTIDFLSGSIGDFTGDYIVVDDEGGIDTGQYTISVLAPNIPPVGGGLSNFNMLNGVGQTLAIDLLAGDSDPDGGPSPLSITNVNPPSNTTYAFVGGEHRFTAIAEGQNTGFYTLSDGEDQVNVNFTITVIRPNTPPVGAYYGGYSVEVEPGETKVLGLVANDYDADNDTLSISSVNQVSNAMVVWDGQSNSVDVTGGSVGVSTGTYYVTDNRSAPVAVPYTVTVTPPPPPPNQPPTAFANTYTVTDPYTTKTFDVLNNDSDPEGDRLEITISPNPKTLINGTVSVVQGTGAARDKIRFVPNGQALGSSFNYTITDTAGNTDSTFVIISVQSGGGGEPELPY